VNNDLPILSVQTLSEAERSSWIDYIVRHPGGTAYHLPQWNEVIRKTYGHSCHCLFAGKPDSEKERPNLAALSPSESPVQKPINPPPDSISSVANAFPANPTTGVLALVHMRHPLFGKRLVSLPFLDLSGVLADDQETEQRLLCEAVHLAQKLGVDCIELRQTEPFKTLQIASAASTDDAPASFPLPLENHGAAPLHVAAGTQKVRMLLELPDSPEKLMSSFKSKLRSQIRKPLKEGCSARIGGAELLRDFYKVFLVNMRDLGSPVHSPRLMRQVLTEFQDQARVVVVSRNSTPLAAGIVMGFQNTLYNPWASSLKGYGHLSPNMLLYWTMLEYACEKGYKAFDFGRCTPGEGTYRFKEQWGACPSPLYWYTLSLNGKKTAQPLNEKSKFDKAIAYWQKMPLPLTRWIGPLIRRHISL
jgi:FemAB-related protein (PEP-CTERM system-associated)